MARYTSSPPLGTSIEASEIEDLDKGTTIVGDGTGAPAKLAVGTNDFVLTAASGEATGLKWSAPTGGGEGHVFIDLSYATSTVQGPWVYGVNANYVHNIKLESNGADADEIVTAAFLAAGTYTVQAVFNRATNNGILDIEIDSTSVGTIDTYGAAQAVTIGAITSVSVAADGIKAIGILCTGKNASSSDHYITLNSLSFIRTA